MKDRRRNPRFQISQPALIRLPGHDPQHVVHAIAHNVSREGALLLASAPLALHTEIELTILLPQNLKTSCLGRVIRVERDGREDSFGVAVQCRGFFSDAELQSPLTFGQSG